MHCCGSDSDMASFFIRVDAANEAVYELVAEPIQEPQAGEPQAEEVAEQATKEVANPAELQGKPRSITHKFSILMFIYVFVHLRFRSCMEPKYAYSP